MKKRPRILLLIPHLGGGGAERVIAHLAQGLSQEKYELHLGLLSRASPLLDQLPPWVNLHVLGVRRVRAAPVPLLQLVRRLKPDLILSGIAHLNFLVLLLRPFFPKKTAVLVRQNGTVSAALAFGGLPGYTNLLYRLLYPHADRIVCQTSAMAEDLARESGLAQERLAVLPNPVDIDAIRAAVQEFPDLWLQFGSTAAGPRLLAIGRLSLEKGFDLLLRAMASVRKHYPDAHLAIAGAGPEEATLKRECRELGLQAAVHFLGHLESPCACFPGASAFVLSSRHEGLPNALLEAAAARLPIVALPASQGLTELLRDQPGVWIAPEISAEALSASLLDALSAIQPGQRFAHPFVEQFRLQPAIHAYEDLIDAVLQERQT